MKMEYTFENRGTVQVRPVGGCSIRRNSCWYALLGMVLLLLALAGWLFFSGYLTPVNSLGIHAVTLRGKMDEQEKLIEKQATTIRDLEGKLASAKRGEDVQVAANDELNRKFAAAEADLAGQRDKLALYEEILSPAGLEQGVHIQHFAVKERLVDTDGKKLNGQRLYQYHLVLANIRGGDAGGERQLFHRHQWQAGWQSRQCDAQRCHPTQRESHWQSLMLNIIKVWKAICCSPKTSPRKR